MTGITREQARALADGLARVSMDIGIPSRTIIETTKAREIVAALRSFIAALDERDAAQDRAKRAEGAIRLVMRERNDATRRAETAEAAATALTAQMEKLREALADIADPQRLTSYGDPGTLRDHASRALKETPNA